MNRMPGAHSPATPTAALHVRGVDHAFARQTVLEDIDFELRAGEIVALVGPSGCGKTTLLHLCAQLLYPDSGTIDNGFLRQACMFQQPRLLPWKSTLDNIALGLAARGAGRGECEHRAREMGLQLGLAHADFAKFPHQLSGGMQSRVALARALVIEPDLLLLDEPFSALDIGLREEMYRLLLDHLTRRSVGVLMITHDLTEAVRLSDRILVMAADPGRIIARIELERAATQRDDAWIHAGTAQLLARADVRHSFGLPPMLAQANASPHRTAAPAALAVAGTDVQPGVLADREAPVDSDAGATPAAIMPVLRDGAGSPSVVPFVRKAPRC